jgi:SlyX protein
MSEKKIVELEEKIAHLQNTLDDLNMVVFRQGKVIDKLNLETKELKTKLQGFNSANSDQIVVNDDKPPHY